MRFLSSVQIPRSFLLLMLVAATCNVTAPHLFSQTGKPAKRAAVVVPPKWFTHPPADEVNLITRGRGEGKDQQLAIDRAVLAARGEIAATVESRWKVLLTAIRDEGIVVDNPVLESITIKGSKIRTQKAVKLRKVWTAFVLVTLPKTSVPVQLLERARQDARWFSLVKHSKAIQNLETSSR